MKELFFVRDTNISPPLALAPMVGLSHSALRLLIIELGGAGLFFSEMLSAKHLPHDNARLSPSLIRTSLETPLFYQLFLRNPVEIEPAVIRLHDLGADGIDLNLGCPAPNLRKQGAGCELMDDPDHTAHLVSTLRSCTRLPFSAKIRLGKTLDEEKLLDFCKMLEDNGIDLITVHGRLKGEKFCRKPRWEWIGKVKKAVNIPVIANGGIFSVADARKCLEMSGADGLMLGRGAAMRPWLFAEIASQLFPDNDMNIQVPQRKEDVFFRFCTLLQERFQPERCLGRLKQFTHYFSLTFRFGHHLATSVQTSDNFAQAHERAASFFEKSGDDGFVRFAED